MSKTQFLPRGVLAALALVAACGTAMASEPPVTDAATLATLDKVLAGDHRSDANRARDAYRHPRQTLEFFGLKQDMTVMEVWPGGGGWYTEVLAPTLREHGKYIAASWDPKSTSKYVQDNSKKYADKLACARGYLRPRESRRAAGAERVEARSGRQRRHGPHVPQHPQLDGQ